MSTYFLATNGNDDDPGDKDNPWATFKRAGKALKPGDELHLLAGSYYQRPLIDFSGSLDAPISIVEDEPGTAVIDGRYKLPTGTAKNSHPTTGADYVFDGLVRITGSHIRWQVPITQARGWGAYVTGKVSARIESVELSNCEISHCRFGVVRFQNCNFPWLHHVNGHHCGDYYQEMRDFSIWNLPMGVNFVDCDDALAEDNDMHELWCEGINPSQRSARASIRNNNIWNTLGIGVYIHGAQAAAVFDNLIYHTLDKPFARGGDAPHGIVVNNEEEFVLTTNGILVQRNTIVGMEVGLAVWGNEGSANATDGVDFIDNTIVNCHSVDGKHGSLLVRKGNREGIYFGGNTFYQPDGHYGEVLGGMAGVTFDANIYSSEPPETFHAPGDVYTVKLLNPDAPLVAGLVDIANYKPITVPPVEPPTEPPVEPPDPQTARNERALAVLGWALAEVQACKPGMGSVTGARYDEVISALEHEIAYFERFVIAD